MMHSFVNIGGASQDSPSGLAPFMTGKPPGYRFQVQPRLILQMPEPMTWSFALVGFASDLIRFVFTTNLAGEFTFPGTLANIFAHY